MRELICTVCGEECFPNKEDSGIGGNYYGGSYSVHSEIWIVSDCCGGGVMMNDVEMDEESYNRWCDENFG